MPTISASLPGALAALLAVLALILLSGRGVRLLRNRGGLAGAGRRIDIRAAVAVDPRRRLVLVACDGHEVLLLTGGGQDLIVGWLPRPRDATADAAGDGA
jgi:flagellar protein FliO/FliZ